MATQRQIKVSHVPLCVCNARPKAYVTIADLGKPEGPENTYHLECYACQHITPKLYSLQSAITFFMRISDAVRVDRMAHNSETKRIQGL
jgi:hypothetical protein